VVELDVVDVVGSELVVVDVEVDVDVEVVVGAVVVVVVPLGPGFPPPGLSDPQPATPMIRSNAAVRTPARGEPCIKRPNYT
jgi:hypothetical protein